jgi:hypothetical protein
MERAFSAAKNIVADGMRRNATHIHIPGHGAPPGQEKRSPNASSNASTIASPSLPLVMTERALSACRAGD